MVREKRLRGRKDPDHDPVHDPARAPALLMEVGALVVVLVLPRLQLLALARSRERSF
jgi:hypothetical protein